MFPFTAVSLCFFVSDVRWMHHAFPRECPYPHEARQTCFLKRVNPLNSLVKTHCKQHMGLKSNVSISQLHETLNNFHSTLPVQMSFWPLRECWLQNISEFVGAAHLE